VKTSENLRVYAFCCLFLLVLFIVSNASQCSNSTSIRTLLDSRGPGGRNGPIELVNSIVEANVRGIDEEIRDTIAEESGKVSRVDSHVERSQQNIGSSLGRLREFATRYEEGYNALSDDK